MNEYRILIVEDEEDLASLLKLNLETEGYKAITVNNGDKAIHIMKEQNFNLILMDIMLPGIDGLTATESIKLTHPHIPVIFLTARGTSQDKIIGLKKEATIISPNLSTSKNFYSESKIYCTACSPWIMAAHILAK